MGDFVLVDQPEESSTTRVSSLGLTFLLSLIAAVIAAELTKSATVIQPTINVNVEPNA